MTKPFSKILNQKRKQYQKHIQCNSFTDLRKQILEWRVNDKYLCGT